MILDKSFPSDIRVEKETSALLKAGHEIFLVCPRKGNFPKEENINGIRIIRIAHYGFLCHYETIIEGMVTSLLPASSCCPDMRRW